MIIAISYTIGCSIADAIELNINDYFTKDLACYKLKMPLDKSQWRPSKSKNEKQLFQPIIEDIDLPLPAEMAKALSNLSKEGSIHRPNLFDQSNTLKKKLLNRVVKEIRSLRKNYSSHIALVRIAASLKSELYVRYQNPTLVYLLADKTNFQPPHTRYYYVPSKKQLLEAWLNTQERLWGNCNPPEN